ncbi:hypothetical protein ACFFF5_10935 [Lederbergia wuyishanensis]|uniref:Replication protein n=1 Tax=Lederbergia wuyishanensis TaxID=1347903 RepID=A0ABU0D4G2_9BACI|nr:hypothetical protein [Lederbergia wuyishanensis]MCJ8008143.1 hypothetical protein [Lederbergia wuyishanensis]MDQ0343271.1 hypothetical protein [Lederbergia wuyishanensis]
MTNRMNKNDRLELSPNLALKIGLNESIVFQQLATCIHENGILMDGDCWVSLTYEQWQEIFPFWSTSTIKRIFTSLQKMGFIKIEQHGKHRYDRTNWYCICSSKNKGFILKSTKNLENIAEQSTQSETNPTNKQNLSPEEEQKYKEIEKRLNELHFFPLKEYQKKELIEACQSFSLSQIMDAIQQTEEKSIYAWKYAYKVLITNGAHARRNKTSFRKPIRTESLPDWFGKEEKLINFELDEEMLIKKKRLEAIQAKYRAG